jgi:L-methionine (R)-S-oxide reductase
MKIDNFCTKLLDISQFLEKHINVDECLNQLAAMSAEILHVKNCSIMLLDERSNSQEKRFRVFANFGYLPGSVFCRIVKIDEGIANYVARTGNSLLVKDIQKSPFSSMARHINDSEKCFISVPLSINERIIGVINISAPLNGRIFNKEDFFYVKILAIVIGKSIHITQLQNLLNSRYAQMALVNQTKDKIGNVSLCALQEPKKLAKILAKTFYKEMTKAGFGPDNIINAATEIISLLNDSLRRHKKWLQKTEK